MYKYDLLTFGDSDVGGKLSPAFVTNIDVTEIFLF